jgi:benzylsuccinate CoA-transferase BbsF subunit
MTRQSKTKREHLRILDFSWVLAGPYATRLLADFGAEIIKVQPLLAEAGDGFSRSYYNSWNRNKLGITLNLNKLEGLEIARKLVRISDVVVENFSARVMANWGLDYSELTKITPDIIMVSLSIKGHQGSHKGYTGYGPTAQAFSGISALTAYSDQPPSGIGYSYADHVAALYASLALLGALEYHRRTGRGQYIDLSETESAICMIPEAMVDCTLKGTFQSPGGINEKLSAPYGVYRCMGKDRWCAISVTSEKEWAAFKQAIGNPSWTQDPEFSDMQSRAKNHLALDELVQTWTLAHSAEEVMIIMQNSNIPAGVVQNAKDLAHDQQLRAASFFVDISISGQPKMTTEATPIRMKDNPVINYQLAPQAGQDNDYVYRELIGLGQKELIKLKKENVI